MFANGGSTYCDQQRQRQTKETRSSVCQQCDFQLTHSTNDVNVLGMHIFYFQPWFNFPVSFTFAAVGEPFLDLNLVSVEVE